jgi:putative glutathione S-transferase
MLHRIPLRGMRNIHTCEYESVTPRNSYMELMKEQDIYFQVDPEYKGRFTVPVLYDKKQGKIVSNESADIIRMFYTEVRSR